MAWPVCGELARLEAKPMPWSEGRLKHRNNHGDNGLGYRKTNQKKASGGFRNVEGSPGDLRFLGAY